MTSIESNTHSNLSQASEMDSCVQRVYEQTKWTILYLWLLVVYFVLTLMLILSRKKNMYRMPSLLLDIPNVVRDSIMRDLCVQICMFYLNKNRISWNQMYVCDGITFKTIIIGIPLCLFALACKIIRNDSFDDLDNLGGGGKIGGKRDRKWRELDALVSNRFASAFAFCLS